VFICRKCGSKLYCDDCICTHVVDHENSVSEFPLSEATTLPATVTPAAAPKSVCAVDEPVVPTAPPAVTADASSAAASAAVSSSSVSVAPGSVMENALSLPPSRPSDTAAHDCNDLGGVLLDGEEMTMVQRLGQRDDDAGPVSSDDVVGTIFAVSTHAAASGFVLLALEALIVAVSRDSSVLGTIVEYGGVDIIVTAMMRHATGASLLARRVSAWSLIRVAARLVCLCVCTCASVIVQGSRGRGCSRSSTPR
jgi:hypothetical protein